MDMTQGGEHSFLPVISTAFYPDFCVRQHGYTVLCFVSPRPFILKLYC